MKPVIAIVGRPNVGKSTLFNRLTSSRDALVADRPGVTRDRQYGTTRHGSRVFIVIDTGGLGEEDHDSKDVADLMTEQAMLAASEASVLVWIVDGRTGLTNVDETLITQFRKLDKPIFLAVNKVEGFEPDQATQTMSDFYCLGLDSVLPISAKRGDGVNTLLDTIAEAIPETEEETEEDIDGITISVLGRPNVGKSTLVNRMIGEERVLTFDMPGTTRDSIKVPFQKNGKDYILIDTAGVRRKSKVHDVIEKFSILKAFEAIEAATIIILVLDATEGVTDQDSTLLGMIEDSGKSVIIIINKVDGIPAADKERVKAQLDRKFVFVDYAVHHDISALHGTGVGDIFKSVNKIEKSLDIAVSTSDMTDILEYAVNKNPPQLVNNRRIKLRYAHIGGTNPIRVIIHGNQIDRVPDSYRRYLTKIFRKKLRLVGTTVLIDFRGGDNPYKDKKNELTKRQINKRKRLMKFVKKR
ncbi:MAG TPA: ribosome biogenesis GTPase Der [Thiotrichaceae bacterium]|jgi:GTP-binding protein|nr:ribosome biogenesis GTPase Der [Thiotrichaceae bacterium]HIM08122.1 ribosome biogenesis GTPase Der [Gammaproteobacteria bacterium]